MKILHDFCPFLKNDTIHKQIPYGTLFIKWKVGAGTLPTYLTFC